MRHGFLFHRFHAAGHELANVHLQWSYQPSRQVQSLAELALLLTWKISYMFDWFIPPVRRALKWSIANVYLGALLPQSNLRLQLAKLRNDCQYRTEGAGINVGFAPRPGQPIDDRAVLHDASRDRQKH